MDNIDRIFSDKEFGSMDPFLDFDSAPGHSQQPPQIMSSNETLPPVSYEIVKNKGVSKKSKKECDKVRRNKM